MSQVQSMLSLIHMPIKHQDRPRYNPEQLSRYFHRIHLSREHLSSPVLHDQSLASTKEHGLPLLKALHRHHLTCVPFENLELHYSAHKKISLHMDDLYLKFVVRGLEFGRGGRCMENNGFFGTVLRSLGYDVRNCAGRVSRMQAASHEVRDTYGDTYEPWNHMLNLVKLDNIWYVVDVGMGAIGPQIVYPLEDGFEAIAMPPRRIRLQKRSIPEHSARSEEDAQKLWCFDICRRPDVPESKPVWTPTYCFTETEFLPQDYEMMSWYTSTNPKSFFTYSVLCTKFLLDEEQQIIIGDITLFNDKIRKTVHGQHVSSQELKTEEERILALRDLLGVHLKDEEINSIPTERRLG